MHAISFSIHSNKICAGVLTVCFFVAAFMPFSVSAATLSLSPASGSYGVGGIFTVQVVVSSIDQALNAVSGVLSFPPDKLSVVSVSNVGSVVNFWIREPTFSNTSGTVSFEGVVVTPGYQGARGAVLSITFQGKAAGTVLVQFSESAVLANDGIGTNILANIQAGQYLLSVTRPGVPAVPTPAIAESTISPPVIEDYTKQIKQGESIIISGTTYPESRVDVWLQYESGEPSVYTVESNAEGVFRFLSEPQMQEGIYVVWTEVVDESEAHSGPSDELTIGVYAPAYIDFGERAIDLLSLAVPAIALLLISAFSIWYSWSRFSMYRRRMRREHRRVEMNVERTFDLLREDVEKELRELHSAASSGRKLTKAERETLDDLVENLNVAEEYIRCQLDDMKCRIDDVRSGKNPEQGKNKKV